MDERTIGILGGMGPEATSDLFLRIIRATPAKRDQDHYRTIIYSDPKIPDRTAAILGGGPDPVPEMLMAARVLEGAGADFIIIPCNTAHHFIEELRRGLGVPVLNMIELTAERIARDHPGVRRAGLLASTGTVKSGTYERAFGEKGIGVLAPPEGLQERVMEAIYDQIKAGDLGEGERILHDAGRRLEGMGADAVICGCTEVSLVLKEGDLDVPVVDPMQVLAEAAVEAASGKTQI